MTSTSPKTEGDEVQRRYIYCFVVQLHGLFRFFVVIKRTRLGLSINARNRIRVELMVENTAICSCVAFLVEADLLHLQ